MIDKIEEVKKIHDLKTWRAVFQAVKIGKKTGEYRKNDRNFKIGEYLNLREWDETKNEYTGESLLARIQHIIYGGEFNIPQDYCVMSITIEPSQLIEESLRRYADGQISAEKLAEELGVNYHVLHGAFRRGCHLFEPQPNESRLPHKVTNMVFTKEHVDNVVIAKDAECQARVRRIFEDIDKYDSNDEHWFKLWQRPWWKALKKREGIG